VTIYGFNDKVGVLSYQDRSGADQFKKPYSEATAQMIDEEARALVRGAYERTTLLIKDKSAQLELLAEHLLKHEMLTHNDVLELLGPRPFEMNDHYKEYVDTSQKWKKHKSGGESPPGGEAAPPVEPAAPELKPTAAVTSAPPP
jgi:AFG3 family protein